MGRKEEAFANIDTLELSTAEHDFVAAMLDGSGGLQDKVKDWDQDTLARLDRVLDRLSPAQLETLTNSADDEHDMLHGVLLLDGLTDEQIDFIIKNGDIERVGDADNDGDLDLSIGAFNGKFNIMNTQEIKLLMNLL